MKTISRHFPKFLLGLYALEFIVLGIQPYSRAVWWAENIPILLIVATLVILYWRGIRLSNFSYGMMSFLIFMHTVGGHYTFERVPFGAVTRFFGWQRNNYDRIAHFTVGFYAFPIAELLSRYQAIRSRFILFLFPIFAIATVAAFYEIIEWLYAAADSGSAGQAFLGSQGDIWDAQKDMLADILGAFVAMILYFFVRQ